MISHCSTRWTAAVNAVDQRLRATASLEREARLLMTIPGVGVTVAVGLLAAIGDVHRLATPEGIALIRRQS